MYLLNDVKFLRYINVDANTYNISFSKPCADLEEGVGGVFGLGQIKVEYLHSKITENMPRTLWQTQIFCRNPLPSLQKDSESKHDNSFKFFFS